MYTAWIQTTATLGFFLSLFVILATRLTIGEAEFATWGWRVPFITFIALLGISVWIRLLVTGFFLPETKDRPLDEQYQD